MWTAEWGSYASVGSLHACHLVWCNMVTRGLKRRPGQGLVEKQHSVHLPRSKNDRTSLPHKAQETMAVAQLETAGSDDDAG